MKLVELILADRLARRVSTSSTLDLSTVKDLNNYSVEATIVTVQEDRRVIWLKQPGRDTQIHSTSVSWNLQAASDAATTKVLG